MRWLLVLLALAPLAAAQGALPPVDQPTLAVTIAPLDAPIVPLGPFHTLPVRVAYTFLEAAPGEAAVAIALTVAEHPAWAVTTLSPATVYVQPATPPCGCQRTIAQDASLLVSTTVDGPAFAPTPVRVHASAEPQGLHAAAEADAEAPVQAGFFSILEATTPTTTLRMAAGQSLSLPVTVQNRGNAPTLVAFTVEGGAPGVTLTAPAAVTIGSRQRGDTKNQATINATLATEPTTLTREPVNFTLHVRGALASDPTVRGDATRVTFIVEVRPLGEPTRAATPGPEGLLAGAMLALSALGARKRGS
jgi:hypothetical protein